MYNISIDINQTTNIFEPFKSELGLLDWANASWDFLGWVNVSWAFWALGKPDNSRSEKVPYEDAGVVSIILCTSVIYNYGINAFTITCIYILQLCLIAVYTDRKYTYFLFIFLTFFSMTLECILLVTFFGF